MNTKEELQREYDELQVKLDLLEKEVEDTNDPRYDNYHKQREETESKWEQAKDLTGDAWEETKDDFRTGLDKLKEAYRDMKNG